MSENNTNSNTDTNTNTNTNNDSSEKKMSEKDIAEKLKTNFPNFNETNISILAHYLYNFPDKWSSSDTTFITDINKLMSDAFTYNVRSSNICLGVILAICFSMFFGIIWYIIVMFINRNNNNLLNDPSIVNTNFI